MKIDWGKELADILSDQVPCPRCGVLNTQLVAGYSRETWAAEYAPRCEDCTNKDDCESRKLVFLCEGCARELKLRARSVDQEGMMTLLMNDCRKDLEECLDYLAEYWQEDLEVDPEEADARLEDVAPDIYEEESTWRSKLEEEYLSYHRWFRERRIHIPEPEWRSRYVEEIIGLGYSTVLGD
ncbi:MAG TPA: hypothetical protein VH951_13775 [Dehalococcoidia bacterium]|jgi:hypothetical protein